MPYNKRLLVRTLQKFYNLLRISLLLAHILTHGACGIIYALRIFSKMIPRMLLKVLC